MSGEESGILGRWGETLVAEELRREGCTLLAAGWRCRMGEIDLIASDETYLRFVEVKLRKNDHFAKAMEAVDRRKQEKLRITAELYLAGHPTRLQPRFDVAEVYAAEGLRTISPKINYIEDAFQ
ncbi:MAG: YraN family protein [Pseudoflavonifractor sp.]|nr:YraN family protein [Pseudoflavonifractor sp.]